MDKPDPDFPHLTQNDKSVLKKIIDHAKIPDSEIAKSIGISPQAVFKIRNKLERLGIIKGYIPILDFKKIGINVLVVLIIRLTPEVWKKYTDDLISQKISRIPYVIAAYRVADVRASHILILGFRDTDQKEFFLGRIQTKLANEIEIKDVFTFSVDKVIVQNTIGLLYGMLDKKDDPNFDFLID